MERRSFLKKAGITTAAAAASLSVGAPAVIASPKKIRWQATTFWNPKVKIMFDMVKEYCETVKIMSDGQLEIKLYGGGELVPLDVPVDPEVPARDPDRLWGPAHHPGSAPGLLCRL